MAAQGRQRRIEAHLSPIAGSDDEERGTTMQIDCETCPVRGEACGDCVVTALLGPPELDEREGAALVLLADRGLVSPLRDPRPATDVEPSDLHYTGSTEAISSTAG